MKVALLVAALPAVLGDEPQRNHVPASNAHERIVGGSLAPVGTYPWMTLVTNTYVNWGDEVYANCGGTLIDAYWVLTAAHCETPVGTQVLIGAWNRKRYWEEYPGGMASLSSVIPHLLPQENGQALTWTPELKTVTHAIPHPWYSDGPHDVMLLKLDTPSSLTPIHWDNGGAQAFADGDFATVMGWGNTEGAHDDDMFMSSRYGDGYGAYSDGDDVTWHPAHLREVEVPIVDDATCQSLFALGHEDGEFCAGNSSGGVDSCQGDSGGPIIVDHGTQTLIGVVSWGYGCADAGYYGVYADVAFHDAWIRSYLSPMSCASDADCAGNCHCAYLSGVDVRRRKLSSSKASSTATRPADGRDHVRRYAARFLRRKPLFGYLPDDGARACECHNSW